MSPIFFAGFAQKPFPSELSQLAFAASLCCLGTVAAAQPAPEPASTSALPAVTVQDSAIESLKTPRAPSAKFTAPLLDTPKTVQVIPEELLQQTGVTSLQEALRATPGITFGNGEGGNPAGDQPFIRGMDAQSSTFVDGMRDIAAGTREVFNLEAVEVIKGADSAYAGRGGAGGSINLQTKTAKPDDFIRGDVGLGTDRHKRGTLDLNRKLGDTVGFRLNAMAHDADVAGRNGPENKRWGIAPTVTLGMGTPTEFSLSWQHLKTDNVPDGGVPYRYSNAAMANMSGGSRVTPAYGNSRENWYGLKSRDFETEKSDLLTAVLVHKFSDTNQFRNSTRYSKSKQDYLWTQPDDSKGNVPNGYVWRRGNARVADTKTLQNVSEFSGKAQTGSVAHSFAVGLELAREESKVRSAAVQSGGTCSAVSLWCASLDNPDSSPAWDFAYSLPAEATRNKINTVALYAFDTLKFNEQWQLNAGLRVDHYKVNTAGPASTGRNPAPAYDIRRSDTLFNYQMGVVYKPAPHGSVYVNVSSASRPGGSALGSGNEDLTINSGNLADLKPEKTRSIELGTKWDVLDQRMAVSAALFRNDVRNVRITENGVTYMGGNKVVNGLELGFSGRVLSNLSVFGGYTYMASKQKNMGAGNVANGQPFGNTPKHSLSVWASYKPDAKLTVGLGVYAQSSVNQGYARSTVDGGLVTKGAAGYARYDAMVAYQINPQVAFQLNVYNLGNKAYYSGVRSPHYAHIAAGRSAVASLKFTF